MWFAAYNRILGQTVETGGKILTVNFHKKNHDKIKSHFFQEEKIKTGHSNGQKRYKALNITCNVCQIVNSTV